MARLANGSAAPDFDVQDHMGNPVKLSGYRGSKLMASFYRYASCPLCNLRMHELIQLHPEFSAQGLDMVAVFQSPMETIREYVGKQECPFPIVPDPKMALYSRYGVEKGWGAMFTAFRRRLTWATKKCPAAGGPPGNS